MAVISCGPVAVGVYWREHIEGVPPFKVHDPTLKLPVLVWLKVTVPVGVIGDLPVTVSATVAVQETIWVGATALGVHDTVVDVGSSVTVIVVGAAVLLVA